MPSACRSLYSLNDAKSETDYTCLPTLQYNGGSAVHLIQTLDKLQNSQRTICFSETTTPPDGSRQEHTTLVASALAYLLSLLIRQYEIRKVGTLAFCDTYQALISSGSLNESWCLSGGQSISTTG